MPRPAALSRRPFLLSFVLAAAFAAGLAAQGGTAFAPKALTSADYARAESFLGPHVTALVLNATVRPTWLPDGRFWYRAETPDGQSQSILIDPVARTRTVCAPGLAACQGIAGINEPAAAGRGGRGGRGGGNGQPPAVASPDGKSAVFIRDWNLWIRDTATGKERALTTDGVQDFGYATDNAGWSTSDRPVVLWSPDSARIFTFQQDQRGDGDMYLVTTAVGHPQLKAWKYPLPGDKVVTTIQRVVIDAATGRMVRFKMPPDQHRSTLCDDVNCGGFGDVQWSPDSRDLAFVSTSRDHKNEVLYTADLTTGAIHEVLSETVPTFFESGNGAVNWKYLPASHEVIWFSERSDWGQLYLYDLATGTLKNEITHGDGNVTNVTRVDDKSRVIYFYAVGKEPGRDPYFIHYYKVNFDGTGQTLLTPDNGNHSVDWAPSYKYFIDTDSTPDAPPVSVLRDADGRSVMPLEKPTSRSSWPPAGSRRRRSPSSAATASPTATG